MSHLPFGQSLTHLLNGHVTKSTRLMGRLSQNLPDSFISFLLDVPQSECLARQIAQLFNDLQDPLDFLGLRHDFAW